MKAVCARDFCEGDCVLCENTLLVLPQNFTVGSVSQALKDRDRDLWLPQALRLFHPCGASAEEARWDSLNALWRSAGHVFASSSGSQNASMLRRLWCVVTLNAFGGGDAKRRTHLFEIGSRFNHSCSPSCCRTVGSDGRLIIRAVRPIVAGEEVTISYLKPQALLSPITERNLKLRQYGFTCGCSRCSSSGGDDMRGFGCPSCDSGSIHLPSNRCDSCGATERASTLAGWEAAETRLIRRVAELDGAAGPPLLQMIDCVRQC